MKKIESIVMCIALLEPKFALNTKDWNAKEKEAIAKAYFEITKVSVGKGRSLDLGCSTCVEDATVIIKNYLKAVAKEQMKGAAAIEDENSKTIIHKADNKTNVEDKVNGEPGEKAVDNHLKNLKQGATVTDDKWKSNHETIDAKAKELNFVFPSDNMTKKEKITAIEEHLILA